MIPPLRQSSFVPYSPISINGETIHFVEQAEHVGVLRSTQGNGPNILNRTTAFKNALGAVMSCGLSRGSRSNPASSIRILSLYATPILMSGLASLVLSPSEIATIDQQYKRTLQNLLKLSSRSPAALVYFTAGSLPATAILHLRQISLFIMICRLEGDPLHHHARHTLLTSSKNKNSWFIQVHGLLQQYELPHPLHLLDNPHSREKFKRLAKSKVTNYWEIKLRAESMYLPSLKYFQPQFLSLTTTHRLWTSAGSKPYEVAKARIQLLPLLPVPLCCNNKTLVQR